MRVQYKTGRKPESDIEEVSRELRVFDAAPDSIVWFESEVDDTGHAQIALFDSSLSVSNAHFHDVVDVASTRRMLLSNQEKSSTLGFTSAVLPDGRVSSRLK